MEDINDIRRVNANKILAERFSGKKTRMADALNVQQSYVTKILVKDAAGAKNIGDDIARRLEQIGGKSKNWLDHKHPEAGADSNADSTRTDETPVDNATRAQLGRGRVPIVSWVIAGSFADLDDHFLPPDDYVWVDTEEDLNERQAICLRVENDSMFKADDPLGSFPPGCLIVVKRADLRPPVNGDYVVVRLENEKQATFKQLQIDGDRKYLKPLNPRYGIIEVDRPATYVGVVVEKMFRTRY